VDEREAHLAGEAAPAGLNRFAVAIDPEHAALSTQGRENPCRVPSAPERRIDIVTTRLEAKESQCLIDEHWLVRVLVVIHEMQRLETALFYLNRRSLRFARAFSRALQR
jgi:hypothetical protein